MAPPTHEQIESIVAKKISRDEVKVLLADYVSNHSDLEILSNFLLVANVSYQQVLAVINGQYAIKEMLKKGDDGKEKKAISINFDLNGVPTAAEQRTASHQFGNGVLKLILEAKDSALRKRILKGLVPDADIDAISALIEQKKSIVDMGTLEAALEHGYSLTDGGRQIKFTKSLDLIRNAKTGQIDSAQLDMIKENKVYTPNQLVRLFNNQFTGEEIKALFESEQVDRDQLKGLLSGKYEIHREELDNGKGHLIELRFRPESYKIYLEDILAGKMPMDYILQLFANRYGPEEISAILSANLTAPQLHAFIIGDYDVERIDNPDGSYSLNIIYKKGGGNVTEIEAAPDVEELPTKKTQPEDLAAVRAGTVAGAKEKILKPEPTKAPTQPQEPPKKVKIPDFSNEKDWTIDKASKLKIPSMFAAAAKPNFHRGNVKHLQKDQIKGFYDLDSKKTH